MGMLDPLTALALGRSPYDEVLEGTGVPDAHQPRQSFDHRGRPINPESKRMSRDLIRAHNEVMTLIGIVEHESASAGAEIESQQRLKAREDRLGILLLPPAMRCLDAVGLLGLHGLRERILTFRAYSRAPFWELARRSRGDFSLSRDVLAGAPTGALCQYLSEKVHQTWLIKKASSRTLWWYLATHMNLYATLQRLGIISTPLGLPPLSFFIPFSDSSPIPAPPPLQDYTPLSILTWLGGVAVSSAPFWLWVFVRHTARYWEHRIFSHLYGVMLPNTHSHPSLTSQPTPPPVPLLPSLASSSEAPPEGPLGAESTETRPGRHVSPNSHVQDQPTSQAQDPPVSQAQAIESTLPLADTLGRPEAPRRTSGDDSLSDDEDNEEISATLISFDVESTEPSDASPGAWSAELRQSPSSDLKTESTRHPVYRDSLLTRLPAMSAAYFLAHSLLCLLMAPGDAIVLRVIARAFRLRHGLPVSDISAITSLNGVTSSWLVNFLGSQLWNLFASSGVWSLVAAVSQSYHMDEAEWKTHEASKRQDGSA